MGILDEPSRSDHGIIKCDIDDNFEMCKKRNKESRENVLDSYARYLSNNIYKANWNCKLWWRTKYADGV